MEADSIRAMVSNSNSATIEARERLQMIISTEMTEAIEQIGLTLEACQTEKNRLLDRLEEVYQAVEAVRHECSSIDTTIANKILHLNKLVTQIVQQMAHVNIPDPPPAPPSPPPAPQPIDIDLSPIHERLSSLDHMVNDLMKVVLGKEETFLYMINTRPSKNNAEANGHESSRSSAISEIVNKREKKINNTINQLKKLMRSIQHEDQHRSNALHRQKTDQRNSLPKQISKILASMDPDAEVTNYTEAYEAARLLTENEEADETSHSSDHTAAGSCTICLQERTEEMTGKKSNTGLSVVSEHSTDCSNSVISLSSQPTNHIRRSGEALASHNTDICYYDFDRKLVCVSGVEDYSVKFQHGLVVDLCWWPMYDEWLILSEQGLYRWKPHDNEYQNSYEFVNGEISFRRIAVAGASIFCLFRYSFMVLELSNFMLSKHLHTLAPPEARYRKLGDISVRKTIRSDGSDHDVLGLIWFGHGPGILLEERFVTPLENNIHDRFFRQVSVHSGRYARLASYDNGGAWLISNTGEDGFWIVDNSKVMLQRREARGTWVKVPSGIPINAVAYTESTVCIRSKDGKLEYLEPTMGH